MGNHFGSRISESSSQMPHNKKRKVDTDWEREEKRIAATIDSLLRVRLGIPIPPDREDPFPKTWDQVVDFLQKAPYNGPGNWAEIQ